MFDVKSNGVIMITRGDDATIPVTLKTRGGPYEMQDGDTLTLTVKRFGEETPVLTSVATTPEIQLRHEDTAALEYGKYDADIQLDTWDGKVYTVYPTNAMMNEYSDRQKLGQKAWENFWVIGEVTLP